MNDKFTYNKYGVVPLDQIPFSLFSSSKLSHGSCLSFKKDNYFINCVNILGNWFCRKSSTRFEVIEYNPDMNIVFKKWCRGTYIEIEHKINIMGNPELFFEQFDNFEIPGFARGNISIISSYERYFLLNYVRNNLIRKSYYDIIHEDPSKRPNAIKYKVLISRNILSRKVTILDYSERKLHEIQGKLFDGPWKLKDFPIELPGFFKTKKRFPVIDEEYGFVFGVSFSIARLISSPSETFHQLEIEYWSRLKQKGTIHNQSYYHRLRKISHLKLISAIRSILAQSNFCFDENQKTKIEWLSSICNS